MRSRCTTRSMHRKAANRSGIAASDNQNQFPLMPLCRQPTLQDGPDGSQPIIAATWRQLPLVTLTVSTL